MKFVGFYDYTVILTYLSLVSSVIGMVFANRDAFLGAILCLLVAGICDAFDGTVARTKKNRTEDEKTFGIQLDSLCDVVSFGVFPAFLCHCLGVETIVGIIILCIYCICAVIRLAFFNVQEAKRQQVEEGCGKSYRGLPVTSISIIFPLLFPLYFLIPGNIFRILLHIMPAVVAFLFILDIPIKKFDVKRLFAGK